MSHLPQNVFISYVGIFWGPDYVYSHANFLGLNLRSVSITCTQPSARKTHHCQIASCLLNLVRITNPCVPALLAACTTRISSTRRAAAVTSPANHLLMVQIAIIMQSMFIFVDFVKKNTIRCECLLTCRFCTCAPRTGMCFTNQRTYVSVVHTFLLQTPRSSWLLRIDSRSNRTHSIDGYITKSNTIPNALLLKAR